MRIIHLVRNKVWGGGERYVFDLCSASVEAGYDIMVVTRGIECVDRPFRTLPIELKKLPLGGLFDIVSPIRLYRWLKTMPEDEIVIHVHNFKDAEIALRARRLVGTRKKIAIVCTRHLVKRGGTSARWRNIYRGLDRIVFVSRLAMNEFLSTKPQIDSGKLSVISNSIVVPECYRRFQFKENDCNGKTRILFTGRISPEKGIENLIEMMGLLDCGKYELVIAGRGVKGYEEKLRSLACLKGVEESINWKGFVEDIYLEIRKSDICVFPSVWREPFGLTIIEAMSQGRAVVTTDNGAQPEIITDGIDGILVPPSQPALLAEKIELLSSNSVKRYEIGKNAFETFLKRFDYSVFFAKMKSVYFGLFKK